MSYERVHPAPVPPWRVRLGLCWKLTRGDRPIGWLLLLWPTWRGLWTPAGGVPPWCTMVVFSLGDWPPRLAGRTSKASPRPLPAPPGVRTEERHQEHRRTPG